MPHDSGYMVEIRETWVVVMPLHKTYLYAVHTDQSTYEIQLFGRCSKLHNNNVMIANF